MSLGRLKEHERLLIWRLRDNKTQAQAARKLRVTPARYASMELGRTPLHDSVYFREHRFRGINTNGLQCHERCLLYRRRAGKSQNEVAKTIKRSRYWVNRMERGFEDCDTLLWYWE